MGKRGPPRLCSVGGCGRDCYALGLCRGHYARRRKGLDISAPFPPPRAPLAARFWEKVNRDGATMPHMESRCWEWAGRLTSDGYGMAMLGYKPFGTFRANRVVMCLAHGPLTRDQHVLHRCDNRRCVRPDHLWIGTNADNVADMLRKGRHYGQLHPRAPHVPAGRGRKLTEADVAAIRARRASGEGLTPIARDYGVTIATVSQIALRRTWA